jgi:hypothetical protein
MPFASWPPVFSTDTKKLILQLVSSTPTRVETGRSNGRPEGVMTPQDVEATLYLGSRFAA